MIDVIFINSCLQNTLYFVNSGKIYGIGTDLYGIGRL